MSEVHEVKLDLSRLENNLHRAMSISNFRHFQIAKSYLDEGQIIAGLSYLNHIDSLSMNGKTILAQCLFIRGLILAYELKFTEALALLIRLRNFDSISYMGNLLKDLEKTIKSIKAQKNPDNESGAAVNDESIEHFQQIAMELIYEYLDTTRKLLFS